MRATSGAVFAEGAVSQHVEFATNLFPMKLGTGTQSFVEGEEMLFFNQPVADGVVVGVSDGFVQLSFFVHFVRVLVELQALERAFRGGESIFGYSWGNVTGDF